MNDELKNKLQLLRLEHLLNQWDICLKKADAKQPSYHSFLTDIINEEYAYKKEKARFTRMKNASIPEMLIMEHFPFSKQPLLKKKLIMELYDSVLFMKQRQELIFIGPTGCGKTGLATSFLVHAINCGYRGYFIDFGKLIERLRKSIGDHTKNKVLKQLQSYDVLLIDEMGYTCIDKEIAGLFFNLLKTRNKMTTTIITSQLGFKEWENFLQDKHLAMALLDRITQNCTVFNMSNCISIRPKKIIYASNK